MDTKFLSMNHFPGRAVVAFRITPVFKWGLLSLFFKPKVRIDWGASLCSPNDAFDLDVGCGIAEARLDAYLDGRHKLVDRALAGTLLLDWTVYIKLAREGKVDEAVLDIFSENQGLVHWPPRWAAYVN